MADTVVLLGHTGLVAYTVLNMGQGLWLLMGVKLRLLGLLKGLGLLKRLLVEPRGLWRS